MSDKQCEDVFPWNRNFETGHSEIDQQHKYLVQLLNRLANASTKDRAEEIHKAIDALAHYANYHFKFEEAIWSEYLEGDPWAAAHKHQHDSFLPSVLELQERNSGKPLEEITDQLIKLIIRWLAFHIIDDDKRFAIAVDQITNGVPIEDAKRIADHEMQGSYRLLIETVMEMYDSLSSKTLSVMRDRQVRMKIEEELRSANLELANLNAKLEAANSKLERLSITDKLTDLYNRRYFDVVIDQEIKRARREQKQLVLIWFDLDYFKKLNDDYGHQAGDVALNKVGDCIKELFRRPGDFAFRVGGEEFAVVVTTDCCQKGARYGELVREQIEALHIPNRNSPISDYLTSSVGLVMVGPDEQTDIEELMKKADKRLYAAKKLGRNMVVDSSKYF